MTDLKKKTKEELLKVLEESCAKLHQLQFTYSSGGLKQVRDVRALRKHIARIKTVLTAQA